jgi:hypothetical protein
MTDDTFTIDPHIANVLFLDDMEERHKAFINRFGMNEKLRIWQVRTAADAIGWINRFEQNGWYFDQVFLDHDLSIDDIMCQPGGPSKVPTGMDVVDRICQLSFELAPRRAYVHSMNEPAARVMVAKLSTCLIQTQWVPFHILVA